MTRSQQRFATASAAILVQIALIMLFAHSFLPGKPQQVAREMMLLLRPLLRPEQQAREPARPLPRMIVPPASMASPTPGERAANMLAAPPSALEGIGRALFACSPERYGLLTREEQARCPPPGEGLARLPDADLLGTPKSLSRDAVMWAEAQAAREFTPSCFMNAWGGGQREVDCMIRQAEVERGRATQALSEYRFQKERRNAPPPKPIWAGVPKR
jgi:hypothetical protein